MDKRNTFKNVPYVSLGEVKTECSAKSIVKLFGRHCSP